MSIGKLGTCRVLTIPSNAQLDAHWQLVPFVKDAAIMAAHTVCCRVRLP